LIVSIKSARGGFLTAPALFKACRAGFFNSADPVFSGTNPKAQGFNPRERGSLGYSFPETSKNIRAFLRFFLKTLANSPIFIYNTVRCLFGQRRRSFARLGFPLLF
jgi:hypothetical protein